MTTPEPTDGLGPPDRLARLYAKLAEARNTVSADYYLDRILAHPDYRPREDADR